MRLHPWLTHLCLSCLVGLLYDLGAEPVRSDGHWNGRRHFLPPDIGIDIGAGYKCLAYRIERHTKEEEDLPTNVHFARSLLMLTCVSASLLQGIF